MTQEDINERALDYAAEWCRRYEDRRVYRPSRWVLNLVAKSMVRAYKKGFYTAKKRCKRNGKV